MGNLQITAHNVSTIAHSIRSAWRHRDTHIHSNNSDNHPINIKSTTPTSSLDTFFTHYGDKARTAFSSVLAELAIESDDPSLGASSLRRFLANSSIVHRMLTIAADAPSDSDLFHNTSLFVATALRHPDSALVLLSRSGAPSHVMDIAAESPQVHIAALEALDYIGKSSDSTSVKNSQENSTSSTNSSYFSSALQNGRQVNIPSPSPMDLTHAALAAGQLKQSESRRLISLRFLRVWSQTGSPICKRIADMGLGSRLGELAGSCISSGEELARVEISRLMGNLAQCTPQSSVRLLRMESWLYPLICFAADASGEGNWSLARQSLAGFSACIHRGVELPSRLMTRSVMPLLTRMAEDSAKIQIGERALVRAAVAKTVQALAEGSGVKEGLFQEGRMGWGEIFLGWMSSTNDNKNNRASSGDLRNRSAACPACVDALAALAQPPGVTGLQVAHAWLAEIITFLSMQVEKAQAEAAIDAARKKANAVRPAMRAEPRAAPATLSYFYWMWPSYWKGSSTITDSSSNSTTAIDSTHSTTSTDTAGSNSNGSTAAFAAHAAVANLQQPHVGILSEETEEPSLAEKIVVDEADAVLGPAAAHAVDSIDSSTTGSTSRDSTWTWWLPTWAGGGSSTTSSDDGTAISVDASEGSNERDVTSRTRSDSELALYINAAPVGPAYARAVAMELLEASGRVGKRR